jgi:hypothetical protein
MPTALSPVWRKSHLDSLVPDRGFADHACDLKAVEVIAVEQGKPVSLLAKRK